MKVKYLTMAILTLLVLGAVTLAIEVTPMSNNKLLNRFRKISPVYELPTDKEELKEKIPDQSLIDEELKKLPRPGRFILWTRDGRNVMWGTYGRGYFRGEDNNQKHAWGIYKAGIFAGFHDNEFFWGKYRKGFWKAEGLFGTENHGQYVTFPLVHPMPISEE
jgi:hypothetical protein